MSHFRLSFASLALLLLGHIATSRAELVLSNLQPPPGIDPSAGIGLLNPSATNIILGQEFITSAGGPAYRLNSVTLHLAGAAGNPGDFVLELYTGPLSGIASGPIGQFAVTSNPLTPGHFTFDAVDELILAPSTRYMIVASAPDAVGSTVSQYGWYVGNFQGIPGSGWGIIGRWFSSAGDATWTPVRAAPLQFAVDATTIPEPASAWLAALAITSAWLTRRRRASF